MGNKTVTRPRSRRERKTGISPYQRHRKTEYKYAHQTAKPKERRQ
jgi:hypothetical protein